MTYLEWRNYVYNEWLESLVEMNQLGLYMSFSSRSRMHNDICPWMHDMLKRNYVYNESQEGVTDWSQSQAICPVGGQGQPR